MNDYMLTPEKISEVIQTKVEKWAVCDARFIEEVGKVVSEAQHKKSIGEFIKRIEEFGCQCDALPDDEDFSPYRICIEKLEEWQALKKEALE